MAAALSAGNTQHLSGYAHSSKVLSMKSGKTLTVAIGALALFVAANSFSSEAPDRLTPDTPGLEPAALESLAVDASLFATRTFDWTDSTRNRRVPAKLYLPAKEARAKSMPLILFSHGIGGSREGYSYLGGYFAAHGYASLHVQHVGSDRQIWFGNPLGLVGRLSEAAQEGEALSRVQDMKFALDKVLSGQEGALIDASRIAAAGHSYGANTTMLLAGARIEANGKILELRDPRISSAILLSAPPFYRLGDPAKILSGIEVPTLHITATGDNIQIPGYFSAYEDRVSLYNATGTDKRSQKVLAVFKDGSHSIFTDRAGTGGVTLNPRVKIATRQLALAFLDRVYQQDSTALDRWPLGNASILATYETALRNVIR
jgi:pimeloyl-ACP methyl ester carboxylesterase